MILTFLLVSVLKKQMTSYNALQCRHYIIYMSLNLLLTTHICVNYNLEEKKVIERSDLQPPDTIDGLDTSFLLTSFIINDK